MNSEQIKKEVGARIKNARVTNNLSRKELSAQSGFSGSRLANWECGLRLPSWENAKILGNILQISPIELLCLDSSLNENKENSSNIKITQLNTKGDSTKYLSIPSQISYESNKALIAVEMADESMSPLMRQGDIVVLNKNIQPSHNDLVLVQFKKNKCILIRRFIVDYSNLDSKTITFLALNDSWPRIQSSKPEQYEILGTAPDKLRVFF